MATYHVYKLDERQISIEKREKKKNKLCYKNCNAVGHLTKSCFEIIEYLKWLKTRMIKIIINW